MDTDTRTQAPRQGSPPPGAETTYAAFYRAAERYPSRTALLFLGTGYTFAELRTQVDRFATALHRLGVAKGDRVMPPGGRGWPVAWRSSLHLAW